MEELKCGQTAKARIKVTLGITDYGGRMWGAPVMEECTKMRPGCSLDSRQKENINLQTHACAPASNWSPILCSVGFSQLDSPG